MRRWAALSLAAVACHPHSAGPSDSAPPTSPSPSPSPSTATATATATATPTATPIPLPPPASSAVFPLFRKSPMTPEELAHLVAASPELSRVGTDVSFFDPGDGSYIVRSKADHEGVAFTTQPLLWSPESGAQVLVVAARGKTASFVAAWWPLPEGGYRLASAFVILGEVAPIALAYKPTERTLSWTSCWQCSGEMGHVSVREDHHVVIVQD